MKKKIIIAIFTLLFVLPFSSKLSYSQGISQVNKIHSPHVVQKQIECELQDYQKVMKVTNWNEKISKYFISEAKSRNVSVFDEALPIINIETHGTYNFCLIHHNTNGTYDKGAFQINDLSYQEIVKILKLESKQFDLWSRLNPEFNLSAGLYWLNYLKSKGLENNALFTSYNMGISGAKNYASRNGTYISRYSKDVIKARNEINNVINNYNK